MLALGRRDERGASALEFALVFPLVFALMLGVLQYGLYFWGRSTAAASAREAARRMAVGTDWTCTAADARAQAADAGRGATATLVYDNGAGTARIGSLLRVTVRMTSLAPRLLPVPDAGVIEETAVQRVENLPAQPLSCS